MSFGAAGFIALNELQLQQNTFGQTTK